MKRLITVIIIAFSLTQICLSDVVYTKEMEAKAKKGDAFAQTQLGYCYATGSGIEKNFDKAMEWHKKSASKGNAYAMYCLGLMYLKGEGTSADTYEAAKWFEESYAKGYEKSKEILDKFALPELQYEYRIIHLAEEGDLDAQYTLAVWLSPIVPKQGKHNYLINDENRAFLWMHKAAEAGDTKAITFLGSFYLLSQSKKNEETGFYYYKKGADGGDKLSQYELALCYANGVGVEKNEIKALSWMTRSANNGYAPAMFQLGSFYHHGNLGLSKDITKAIEWYKKGAKGGSSNALVNLGYCYEKGLGVEKDFWKAIECYGQSAELGNETAQNNLKALSYQIAKKAPKYLKNLKSEAQQGDPKSQALIGVYYLGDFPRQLKVDKLDPIKEGTKWVLAAAQNGFSDLFYLAGDIYETGTISSLKMNLNQFKTDFSSEKKDVQQINLPKAKYYYEKCAESDADNNWLGKFRLAKAYYNGEELVGKINYDKSVNYLKQVIEFLEDRAPSSQELKEAYELMGKCYCNGRGVTENQQKGEEYIKKSTRLGNTRPFEQNVLNSWALE